MWAVSVGNGDGKVTGFMTWMVKSAGLAVQLVACGTMFLPGSGAHAQTARLRVLYSFDGSSGTGPSATLTPGPDGSFYGTTEHGGTQDKGTIFKITADNTVTTLASFGGRNGARPRAKMIFGNDGNLYGTTFLGGENNFGTAFRVTPNGAMTRLVSFNGHNGSIPFGGLTLGTDGSFYGTTEQGGNFGAGTVFRMGTNGLLTTLFSFNHYVTGGYPYAGLTPGSDGSFYGTTENGGDRDSGEVFKVTTDGVLSTLVLFEGTNGSIPFGNLTFGADGNLYGTTLQGGHSIQGTPQGNVFRVTPSGELTSLAEFSGLNGANPVAGLTLENDGNFYGTTTGGGVADLGTVFKVTTNGVLTTLAAFVGTNGADPYAGLTLGRDGDFYGTTTGGGSNGFGTIFRLCLHPRPVARASAGPLFDILPGETRLFILSPNNVNAEVVLDGSRSSDFDNDPMQFAWYSDGQTDALADSELATNLFVVGPHSVTLIVDDGCDSSAAQVNFEVITPATAVGQLLELVLGADVGNGNSQALAATLSAAMSSFARADFTPGLNQLTAFQHKVRAELATSDPGLADLFGSAAQRIWEVVEGR